tara:strand:- start:783 stop:1727 length:945 start_codon:yes stop_codon:yes gene_type:complete
MARKSTAEQLAQQEEPTVDVGDEEKGVVVETETQETETVAEEEQGSLDLVGGKGDKPEKAEEEEQTEYTANVQKRIDKLTKKMREAERREKAALQYAENVKGESDQLRTRMQSLDEGYLKEYTNRVDAEEGSAEQSLRDALNSGDAEAIIKAQKQLSEVTVSRERIRQAKVEQEAYEKQVEAYNKQQQQQPGQSPTQQPDPKAEKWAEKNEWFGNDDAMTYAAFGVHKKMVEEEGFDTKSDEYYNELDRRMRDEFPHKFSNGEATKKPAQTVASVSRNTPSKGRGKKVRLTSSQVAIAKKLGVPLEEYAKYVKE